jgi:hypothetical protein
MQTHDWWHLVVLGTTLMGAAGLVIVAAAPLFFEQPPPGWGHTKRIVLGLVAAAGVLLAAEWLGVH